jgi:hypothetical protein
MRQVIRAVLIACLFAPVASQAAIVWSSCTTISSVSNFLANSNQLVVTFATPSPLQSSCSGYEGQPAVFFLEGTDGVSSSNINTFLAMAIAAWQGGQQIMVSYDNSTSSCYGQTISLAGYAAQCP